MLSIVRHQLAAVVVAGWVSCGLAWGQGGLGQAQCHTTARPHVGFAGQAAGRLVHKTVLVQHEGYYFLVQVQLDRLTQRSSVVAIQPVNGTGRLTPADQAQLGSTPVLQLNPTAAAGVVAANAPAAPLPAGSPNFNAVGANAGTPVPAVGQAPAVAGVAPQVAAPNAAAAQVAAPQIAAPQIAAQQAPAAGQVPPQPVAAGSTASLNSLGQSLATAPTPPAQATFNSPATGSVNPPQLVPQSVASGLIQAFAAQSAANQASSPAAAVAVSQTPVVAPAATLPPAAAQPAAAPLPPPATVPAAVDNAAATPAVEQTAGQPIDESKFPSDLPPG